MSFLYSDKGGSTRDCLNFPERPGTPPEIQKYRKSAYLAPGKRFQHYGISDDIKAMNLGEKSYGVQSDPTSVTTADLINHKKLTELQRINLIKAEKSYKGAAREPLGRTAERNFNLPSKFTEDNVPFGVVSKSSLEPAKDIIFPSMPDETFLGEDIYKRTHGSYSPGEQKRRSYKWPVDPVTTVFGVKGDTIAFNGVSRNIAAVLNSGEEGNIINQKKGGRFSKYR